MADVADDISTSSPPQVSIGALGAGAIINSIFTGL